MKVKDHLPLAELQRLERVEKDAHRARRLRIAGCPFESGCPSRVGPPDFFPGNHSDPDLKRGHPMPNKLATLWLLEILRR